MHLCEKSTHSQKYIDCLTRVSFASFDLLTNSLFTGKDWISHLSPTTKQNVQIDQKHSHSLNVIYFQVSLSFVYLIEEDVKKFSVRFEWTPSDMFLKFPQCDHYRQGKWTVSLDPQTDHPLLSILPSIAKETESHPSELFRKLYRAMQILGFLNQIGRVENKPGKWAPGENETGPAFVMECDTFTNWRMIYRYKYAVDLAIVRHDYFVLSDASQSRTGSRFKPIPDVVQLLLTFVHETKDLFEKQYHSRLKDHSGVLVRVDEEARVVFTQDQRLVGNLGADVWIVREALSRIFKSIHSLP